MSLDSQNTVNNSSCLVVPICIGMILIIHVLVCFSEHLIVPICIGMILSRKVHWKMILYLRQFTVSYNPYSYRDKPSPCIIRDNPHSYKADPTFQITYYINSIYSPVYRRQIKIFKKVRSQYNHAITKIQSN